MGGGTSVRNRSLSRAIFTACLFSLDPLLSRIPLVIELQYRPARCVQAGHDESQSRGDSAKWNSNSPLLFSVVFKLAAWIQQTCARKRCFFEVERRYLGVQAGSSCGYGGPDLLLHFQTKISWVTIKGVPLDNCQRNCSKLNLNKTFLAKPPRDE
jgi:hypothetical protein